MNRSRRSNRLLDLALVLNLLALPALSLIISLGWLDRLSGDGQVDWLAHLAVWTYGSTTALLLACLRFRPSRVNVVLTVVSVLIALAFIELGGRVLRIPQSVMPIQLLSSEKLHHVMPVDSYMYQGRWDDLDVFVQTNEDGLRTPYSREEFLKHRTRIAVLGDSFTFGWGVSDQAAYPARLEALIREEFPQLDVAVLNAGVISYSPIIEARQMEQVISAYEPQVVLLMIDMADFGDDHVYQAVLRTGEAAEYFEVPEEREESSPGVIRQLFFAPIRQALGYPLVFLANRGLIAPREAEPNPYYVFEVEIGGVVERNRYFIYRHPLELTRPYFEATLDNVVFAAERASRRGTSFALIVPPRFHHWSAREAPDNFEFPAYKVDEPYQFEYRRFFEDSRKRVDFPIVDLLPDFRATDEYPLVFRDDPHWNVAGHDFVARMLLGHMKELSLIPS